MKDIQSYLEFEIKECKSKTERLENYLEQIKSEEFVSENRITKDDVQLSHGDDLPWFGHITNFVDWLRKTNCKCPWSEWNGTLYSTKRLVNGEEAIGSYKAVGRVKDVVGLTKE